MWKWLLYCIYIRNCIGKLFYFPVSVFDMPKLITVDSEWSDDYYSAIYDQCGDFRLEFGLNICEMLSEKIVDRMKMMEKRKSDVDDMQVYPGWDTIELILLRESFTVKLGWEYRSEMEMAYGICMGKRTKNRILEKECLYPTWVNLSTTRNELVENGRKKVHRVVYQGESSLHPSYVFTLYEGQIPNNAVTAFCNAHMISVPKCVAFRKHVKGTIAPHTMQDTIAFTKGAKMDTSTVYVSERIHHTMSLSFNWSRFLVSSMFGMAIVLVILQQVEQVAYKENQSYPQVLFNWKNEFIQHYIPQYYQPKNPMIEEIRKKSRAIECRFIARAKRVMGTQKLTQVLRHTLRRRGFLRLVKAFKASQAVQSVFNTYQHLKFPNLLTSSLLQNRLRKQLEHEKRKNQKSILTNNFFFRAAQHSPATSA